MRNFDPWEIRKDFPILERKVRGKPLVYLDSAATSQKPRQVIEAVNDFYFTYNSNVLRSTNTLGAEATELYLSSRNKIAKFINAESEEVIFTRGTTEGLNILAEVLTKKRLRLGGKVITTILEHHSNLLPWRRAASSAGGRFVILNANPSWTVDMDKLRAELSDGAEIITIVHVSNVLGTINPIKEISKEAHEHGAIAVVDSAQGVPHTQVDVKDLDVDFLVFSSHKMLGPTGIGVLYAKKKHLENLEPWELGGGMVRSVTLEDESFEDIPIRFEAGTPNIAGVIGLSAAVDYLEKVGMRNIMDHEKSLLKYALEILPRESLELYGPNDPESRLGILPFNLKGVHAHDVAQVLDREGIMVRAGHHCSQPLVNALGSVATVRASFYLYNTPEDVDLLTQSLRRAAEIFT